MKLARKINALSKKTFFTKCYLRIPCDLICTYELQHSLMFSKRPVFLLYPSGNLHRKQMLSSSMLTVFTFEQCRNYQFSTSPEKHGKYPGSLTGLKKFCAVCFWIRCNQCYYKTCIFKFYAVSFWIRCNQHYDKQVTFLHETNHGQGCQPVFIRKSQTLPPQKGWRSQIAVSRQIHKKYT